MKRKNENVQFNLQLNRNFSIDNDALFYVVKLFYLESRLTKL